MTLESHSLQKAKQYLGIKKKITVRVWVHFGLTILTYVYIHASISSARGSWHHQLMVKVTSCGRNCLEIAGQTNQNPARHTTAGILWRHRDIPVYPAGTYKQVLPFSHSPALPAKGSAEGNPVVWRHMRGFLKSRCDSHAPSLNKFTSFGESFLRLYCSVRYAQQLKVTFHVCPYIPTHISRLKFAFATLTAQLPALKLRHQNEPPGSRFNMRDGSIREMGFQWTGEQVGIWRIKMALIYKLYSFVETARKQLKCPDIATHILLFQGYGSTIKEVGAWWLKMASCVVRWQENKYKSSSFVETARK